VCLTSGTPLGFDPDLREIVAPDPARHKRCANADAAACNWLVRADDPQDLCRSCRLTRTRPPADDIGSQAEFVQAEAAKRRLVFQLLELQLPVVSYLESDNGVVFDLLSSAHGPVTTGHDDGVITLDVSESDDAHREWVRRRLDEPYRTVPVTSATRSAHYWLFLVDRAPDRALRALFGDERGLPDGARPPLRRRTAGWRTTTSTYDHPVEDGRDPRTCCASSTLQTAVSFDLAWWVNRRPGAAQEPFERVIEAWLPLTYALNAVNRSMGKDDLYPFVLPPAVLEKLAFVHELVRDATPSISGLTDGG
jgi:hypothetical protein